MKPVEALNLLRCLWKRNTWMLDPRAYYGGFKEVPSTGPSSFRVCKVLG